MRNDVSAQFSDHDPGCPDTKLKTYAASLGLISFTVCFSNLRNKRCTVVDGLSDPSSAPLYFSCMSALHHSASHLVAVIQPLFPLGSLPNLKEEQGGCCQSSSLVIKKQEFLKW